MYFKNSGDLVGIKSKCCGEGRSAYWICGGPKVAMLYNLMCHRMVTCMLLLILQGTILCLNLSLGHVRAVVSSGGEVIALSAGLNFFIHLSACFAQVWCEQLEVFQHHYQERQDITSSWLHLLCRDNEMMMMIIS